MFSVYLALNQQTQLIMKAIVAVSCLAPEFQIKVVVLASVPALKQLLGVDVVAVTVSSAV